MTSELIVNDIVVILRRVLWLRDITLKKTTFEVSKEITKSLSLSCKRETGLFTENL